MRITKNGLQQARNVPFDMVLKRTTKSGSRINVLGTITELSSRDLPRRDLMKKIWDKTTFGEDVLIDFSGYLFGFSIIFLILFLIIRKQRKHQAA